jgi:hypothetical protein
MPHAKAPTTGQDLMAVMGSVCGRAPESKQRLPKAWPTYQFPGHPQERYMSQMFGSSPQDRTKRQLRGCRASHGNSIRTLRFGNQCEKGYFLWILSGGLCDEWVVRNFGAGLVELTWPVASTPLPKSSPARGKSVRKIVVTSKTDPMKVEHIAESCFAGHRGQRAASAARGSRA